MSDKLTNAWCYSPTPPPSATNPWVVEAITDGAHIVIHGSTKGGVQERLFLDYPHLRGVVRWVFEAPPHRKRPDEKPAADKALEVETIPWAALVRRFHPDVAGERSFTTHEIMLILGELRAK